MMLTWMLIDEDADRNARVSVRMLIDEVGDRNARVSGERVWHWHETLPTVSPIFLQLRILLWSSTANQ